MIRQWVDPANIDLDALPSRRPSTHEMIEMANEHHPCYGIILQRLDIDQYAVIDGLQRLLYWINIGECSIEVFIYE